MTDLKNSMTDLKAGSIKVEPTSAVLGAVVSGVDVTNPTEAEISSIYQALLEYGVLFFRGQELTDDQQADFARCFGEISGYPLREVMGTGPSPATSVIKDDADSPPKADGWHTDITWLEEPPKMAFLQPLVLPENGGDTMWGCLYKAYEALSPAMADFFQKLSVSHSIGDVILKAAGDMGEDILKKFTEAFPPVNHPLIRTHPDTKRQALFYAGDFMKCINELEEEESKNLLSFLDGYVTNPNFHIRWSWKSGDLAVWDERRTIHRALGYHYPSHREVRRCTIEGDKPFFSLS